MDKEALKIKTPRKAQINFRKKQRKLMNKLNRRKLKKVLAEEKYE